MATDLTQLNSDVLRAKLKSVQAIHRTLLAIFAVIIITWIVLGYWRTNLSVFIGTVVSGIVFSAISSGPLHAIKAELRRRESAGQD